MKCTSSTRALAIGFLLYLLVPVQADWRRALPGWQAEFPRDHFPHPEFKTEWWYVTGHLQTADAKRRFGFQFTFFRQGLRPPDAEPDTTSRFAVRHFQFAHFAVSDLDRKKFHFQQKISRGAFGESGFGIAGEAKLAWIDDWTLHYDAGRNTFTCHAKDGDKATLTLELKPSRPPVWNGENGANVSQKAAGAGNATHYYSITRLESEGTLVLGGKTHTVTGLSWLDREWGTNQLADNQLGWDWFSLQLDDGSDLMIYQLRTKDDGIDPQSSGTLVQADGTKIHLRREDFALAPSKPWRSNATGGAYPTRWRVQVPAHGIDLSVDAAFNKQELALLPIAYWEGAVEASGSHGGSGYLEMTGYTGQLPGL